MTVFSLPEPAFWRRVYRSGGEFFGVGLGGATVDAADLLAHVVDRVVELGDFGFEFLAGGFHGLFVHGFAESAQGTTTGTGDFGFVGGGAVTSPLGLRVGEDDSEDTPDDSAHDRAEDEASGKVILLTHDLPPICLIGEGRFLF
jgi:hypothetical protein